MEERLINFTPYLKDLFINSENKEQEISEDLELNEDKIPAPLLKAYAKNVWDDNGVTARDVNNRHLELKYLHNYPDERYKAKTDWGKATYNKLTKQQAADLLGLKVTTKREVDGRRQVVEVGMDEPIPEKYDVTVDNNLISENLSNLRFLVDDGENSWSLIEYEYRTENGRGTETEQYFPIFRQSFPFKKLHDLGIETIDQHEDDDEVKITDIRGWKKAKSLYLAIKVADLIFETNEYDMARIRQPYENSDGRWTDADGNEIDLKLYNIRTYYYNLLLVSIYANYVKEVFEKNNIIPNDEDLSKFGGYVKQFLIFVNYLLVSDFTINLNTPIEDIISIIYDHTQDFTTILENGNYMESDIKNYIFDNNRNSTFAKVVGKSVANELASNFELVKKDADNFKKLNSNTTILTQKVKEIINKQLDKIPSSREADLFKKRVRNSWFSGNLNKDQRIKTPAEAQEINGMDFTPFDTFLSRSQTKKINPNDVYDTGSHSSSNVFSKINSSDYINAKKNYIASLNNLNKIKKLQAYYDDEEEYNEEYNEAKLAFLKAKAEYLGGEFNGQTYIGEKNKLKIKIKGYLDINDKEFINHWNKVAQHYNYLQSTFEKLLKLRNAARAITNYSKDTLINLYGNIDVDKLKELENRISEYEKEREDLQRNIQLRRQKIEELQRQIAEQEEYINQDNTNIEKAMQVIAECEKEKADNCGSMEEIIKKAYKQQDDLIKQSEELDNSLKAYKSKIGRKKQNSNNKQAKQIDDRLNTLFNVFKELSDEDPSEDDILSDEEE